MAVQPAVNNDQILDLLFNDSDGLLKEDVPEIQTVDFSELGLQTDGDLLENLLKGANIQTVSSEDLPYKHQKSFDAHTDHDYYAQKSPTNSDSGVSLDNSAYSPQSFSDDQTQFGTLSDSPRSQSNFMSDVNDNQSSGSPAQESHLDFDPLNLEDFNMKDFDMDGIEDVDAMGLMNDGDFLGNLGEIPDQKEVAINFGTMATDDTTLSTIQTESGVTKTIKIIKVTPQLTDTLPFTMKDVGPRITKFPELRLTAEEKDLLSKEGVTLPTDMPLTKDEERVLKAVRRKIRNKASAKESRKRKTEYVDGLEHRVKLCTTENNKLKKKMENLEKQNETLLQQLRRLQKLIVSKTTKPQTTTCVMVLVLSFAFLIVPNFNPFGKRNSLPELRNTPVRGNARSLLHNDAGDVNTDDSDPYGLTVRPGPPWEIPPKSPAVIIPPNAQVDTLYHENNQENNVVEMHASDNEDSSANKVKIKSAGIVEQNDTQNTKHTDTADSIKT